MMVQEMSAMQWGSDIAAIRLYGVIHHGGKEENGMAKAKGISTTRPWQFLGPIYLSQGMRLPQVIVAS